MKTKKWTLIGLYTDAEPPGPFAECVRAATPEEAANKAYPKHDSDGSKGLHILGAVAGNHQLLDCSK